MNIVKKFLPRYCIWFVVFFQEVVKPSRKTVVFYGLVGAIKDFSNIVAFFIQLKLIMILSNPDILRSDLFALGLFNIEKIIVYLIILFFALMFVSLACHMFLAVSVHSSVKLLWENKVDKFTSKVKYKNLYQLMVETITHILIIIAGLVCVLFLDKYLTIPIIAVIFTCIWASLWLARHPVRNLLTSPFRDSRMVFKLLADIGFSMTFVFILIEYYFVNDMVFLYTLLAVLISRILYRNVQELFIKHNRLYQDYYRDFL